LASSAACAADMSAALWAGWELLPAFEAVTGALVTALDLGGSAALAYAAAGAPDWATELARYSHTGPDLHPVEICIAQGVIEAGDADVQLGWPSRWGRRRRRHQSASVI
jgi:hypothetical protein